MPDLPRYRIGLIFTGHMVDLPDRAEPRFPPEIEGVAAAAIRSTIESMAQQSGGAMIGIASGARGGDILFHEGCEALGMPSILVLPFEPEPFRDTSVRGVASGHWEERFNALWSRLPPDRRIVIDDESRDPFGRCNRHMLDLAKCIADEIEIVALWDGADAGKPGGTGAFVEDVRANNGRFVHLDIKALPRD